MILKKINLKIIIERSIPILCVLFILTQLIGALGQINRWDLLDQVANADNFIKQGQLFPSPKNIYPSGTSVYFPGLAYFIALSKARLGQYLIEILLSIAVLILIIFILIQKIILDRISEEKSEWKFFIPSIIVVTILLTNMYLFYAREFKPDTISLLFGYSGLFLADLSKKENSNKLDYARLILGGIICGFAIIFKQQYIMFILGIILYCFYFRSKRKLVFLTSLISSLTFVLIQMFNIDYLYFWTIKVISDDGLLSIKQIFLTNYRTFISFLFFVLISGYISRINYFKISFKKIKTLIYKLCKNEFLWGIIPSILVAFASAMKTGGNHGNTQLGIFLAMPIILLFIKRISNWKIICIAWISLGLILPSTLLSLENYKSALEFRNYTAKNMENNVENVLTGSNVYFASRLYLDKANIINYWTMNLKDNAPSETNLKSSLEQFPKPPNILIVENWSINKETLLSDNRYEILFENKIGIIAKLNKTI